MKKPAVPSALVGIAGVHYVAAELSRRGLVALPTIRNTAAYDIIVATPDGKRHANIQVKTSQNRVSFWPMPPWTKIRTNPKDWYVLVRWVEKEKKFEAFMLRGSEAKKEVKAAETQQKERERRALFPFIRVRGMSGKCEKRWRLKWETWTLLDPGTTMQIEEDQPGSPQNVVAIEQKRPTAARQRRGGLPDRKGTF